jgi:hypothetical protein
MAGCGAEQPPKEIESVEFLPELIVKASTARADRICKLVGVDGRALDLRVRGNAAFNDEDPAGQWQIVEPASWSAAAVESRFDMGLGGSSNHRWRTAEGEMSAQVTWCDECPRDGTDSTIVVHDHSGSKFAGVCRPIDLKNPETETRS